MTNDEKFKRVKEYFENYGGTMTTQKYAQWLIEQLEDVSKKFVDMKSYAEYLEATYEHGEEYDDQE